MTSSRMRAERDPGLLGFFSWLLGWIFLCLVVIPFQLPSAALRPRMVRWAALHGAAPPVQQRS
ncbi:hypothetical protein [Actinoplanes sp. NPDC051859]|uniref:hypothetical protein n=1 Tax=Actinoplanes sp. NPDC051859 TaxID=3363909 RepID=UPI00379C967E